MFSGRSLPTLWGSKSMLWINNHTVALEVVTLWLFNIAMGNGPFIEVYLLKMVIFHAYVK